MPLSAAEVQAEQPAPIEEAVGEHPPETPEVAPNVEIEEARGEGLIL